MIHSVLVVGTLCGFSHGGFTQPPADGVNPKRFRHDRSTGQDFRDLTPEVKARLSQLPPKERQAIEALRRLILKGVLTAYIAREVTIKSNGQEVEQWVRWDPKKGMRRESIRPVGDIFLDNLKKSYFYNPGERRWFVRDSLMPRPEGRLGDVLRRLYKGEVKATLDGQDTVAGRTADIVRVAPPEGGRGPITRVWIDRATGLRLKTEIIGRDGRVLSSSYFLSLDLKPKFRGDDFTPPSEATALPGRSRRQSYKDVVSANREGVKPRLPSYLPTGFSLRLIEVRELPGADQSITVRFGNGLTGLSLVQMPGRFVPKKMLETLGTAQAAFFSDPRGGSDRAYVWRDGETILMLIGSLSDADLKQVANSVR